MPRPPLLVALCVLALTACQAAEAPTLADATPTPPRVQNAYAPAAPVQGTSALFFEVVGGSEPDTLLGALFDGAERAELHETTRGADGMHGMRAVPGVAVAAGETVALRPGGYHVMLLGLREALAEGDSVSVALRFARAGALTARAGVRGLDALPAHAP